jgi:hypothetical protein
MKTTKRIIYVGLGGFGTSAVRRIKERIKTEVRDSKQRRLYAFLAFDSKKHDDGGQGFNKNEYTELIVNDHPRNVIKDPDYRDYFEWYRPLVLNQEFRRNITNGCNAIRAMGRFAFHYNANIFQERFDDAYETVIKSDPDNESNVKVVLISSLAGGTGSGMFLDAIFVISNIIANNKGKEFDFQAYLSTADSLWLRTAAESVIRANTYATLKEFFHFSQGGKEANQHVLYNPDTNPIEVGGYYLPDNIILITDRNMLGNIIIEKKKDEGMAGARDMLTDYVMYEVLTPHDTSTGEPDIFGTENEFLDESGRCGMPRNIESVGVIKFGLPVIHVKKLFSSLLLRGLLELESSTGDDKVLPEEWVNNQKISEAGSDMLQSRIISDAANKKIESFELYGKVADVSRKELVKVCKGKIAEFTDKISSEIEDDIKANTEKIRKSVIEELTKKVDSCMQLSIKTAVDFIMALNSAITLHRGALNKELDAVRKQINECGDSIANSFKVLREVAGDWNPIGRANNIKGVVQDIGNELIAKLKMQNKARAQEAGLALYEAIITESNALLKTLKSVLKITLSRKSAVDRKISELSSTLNRLADNTLMNRNYLSLLNFEQIMDLYKESFDGDTVVSIYKRVRGEYSDKFLYDNKLTNNEWIDKSSDIFSKDVAEALDSHTVDKIIDRFYIDTSKKDLVTTLLAMGSPLFPILRSESEKTGYQMQYLVAAHSDIRSHIGSLIHEFGDPESGISNAISSDRHEVTLYSRIKGLTLHSLSLINSYKHEYDVRVSKREAAIKDGRYLSPIHCWPEAENWEEVLPKNDKETESLLWFIMGRAFSYLYPTAKNEDGSPIDKSNRAYIYNRGNYYYLYINNNEEKLGNSLEKAISNFQENWKFVDSIKKRIEDKIAAQGGSEIKKRLTGKEDIFVGPILDKEIENAKEARDLKKMRLLNTLKRKLIDYISSIRSSRV